MIRVLRRQNDLFALLQVKWWKKMSSQGFASVWENLKGKWLSFWQFPSKQFRVSSKVGETFQAMCKDSPCSFWPWRSPLMGESLVGISRAVSQKQEKNVLPGSSTVDISAGSLVELYVRERCREIGKARWGYAENVKSLNPCSTSSHSSLFERWPHPAKTLFNSNRFPLSHHSTISNAT